MNNIINKQDDTDCIRYLKAQRVAYDHAKNYQFIDLISIIIAIAPTILIWYIPEKSTELTEGQPSFDPLEILIAFGVVWTLISVYTDIYRIKKAKIGATIQEMFDTELFRIPWNKVLVGKKIVISKIIELSRDYSKEDLKGWYSTEIKENLPHNIGVLLCYKCNAIWGNGQRDKFIRALNWAFFLYYGIMISFSISQNTGIYDIVIWLAPSLSFLVYIATTIKNQRESIQSHEHINTIIDDFIERFQFEKIEPTKEELRQIQDLFFTQRNNPHQVPNWFYNIFRKKTSGVADETVRIISEKLDNTMNQSN